MPEGRVLPPFGGNEGGFEYHLKDHLGSVRVAFTPTSNGKTVVQENAYYPFGASITDMSHSGTSDNRYGYNGKEQIKDFGLGQYDYGARLYNPLTARWGVIDPLAELKPWLSPYAYCSNSPINRIDPTGMLDEGYTVDNMGYIKRINDEGGNEYDVLYKKETYTPEKRKNYDKTGKKDGLQISRGIIQSEKESKYPVHTAEDAPPTEYVTNSRYEIQSDAEASTILQFLDKVTDAEWGNTYMKGKNEKTLNLLMTTHSDLKIDGSTYEQYQYIKQGYKIIRNDHIHPSGKRTPSGWTGDLGYGERLLELNKQHPITFRILAGGKYYPYKIPKR